MQFHITYEFVPEARSEAQKRFLETGALPPEGVTMMGRWHSVEGLRGFMIAESDGTVRAGKPAPALRREGYRW